MGDSKGVWIPGLCFGLFMIGFWLGGEVEERSWQKMMVEYDYAEYDSQSGEWGMKPKPIEIKAVGIVKDGKVEKWDKVDVSEQARKLWNEGKVDKKGY